MGVTDWKLITVAGNENFKTACKNEKDSRFYWVQQWGWLTNEMIDMQLKLLKIQTNRLKRRTRLELKEDEEETEEKVILENPCPLPDTTNHQYGWLSKYPDWKLDKFGPFPLCPIKPRTSFTKEEITAMIALQKEERRQRAIAAQNRQ